MTLDFFINNISQTFIGYMKVELFVLVIFFLIIITTIWVFVFKRNRKFANDLIKKERDAKRKMYEIAILKELGDKMGYSLNIQKILEIIVSSLKQFVDYSSVSYMLLSPEKIIFKSHFEKSVSRNFVDQIKVKMLNSLVVILNKDLKEIKIEELFSGAIVDDKLKNQVASYFNIPLVIAGKIEGLLTVSDVKIGSFKEEEMTILYKIVKQATLAVDRLQEVVEQENSKMNAMVSSMTEGVVMTDLDYRIIVANPAVKKAINLENKNDLTIFDFIEQLGDKFDFRVKVEESVKQDKVFFSEEIALQSRFYKIAISPVKNNGKILGSVVIFQDITLDKEIERIKEEFTSMIVHELRSPLDGIKKMIEFIRTSEVKKAQQIQSLQMIYQSSSEMLQLVNNLLDMAKIEAGKFDLVKQKSDIKETVKSRILFYQIASRDAEVTISSFFSKDIPEKVEFDPHTISQVLNNLVSNALKFNKKQGTIELQVLFHKNGQSIIKEGKEAKLNWFMKEDISDIKDSLFIAVSNTGQGIAKDQMNKLFNKFSQVKTVFTKEAGTGLGLAITKSIVESHGGIVGAQSIEGQGATFYFTLPIN
jgi:signal transduction histidine kinase